MAEWLLSSPVVSTNSPSEITSKLYQEGYAYNGQRMMMGDEEGNVGIPAMNAGLFSQDEGREPTSLTREEQALDTSYTMLTSRRNPASTAAVDGKIQEPHLNDV